MTRVTAEGGIAAPVVGAGTSGTPTSRVSTSAFVVAGAATLVLLAFSTRYGPHRDELYFIAAGHHPQWGYPDQPPLTPLLAAAADTLAPGSLLALRLVSALIVGVVVLLTAGLARDLGGGRGAQLLAAVVTGTGSGLLAIGHLLSTATLDLLFWTVLVRLVVRTLQRDQPKLWLAVGLALGLGLENKHLVGFLAAALVFGIAASPGVRHHLRSPWAWAGAAVAIALWLPNLGWQASHGWPQLELAEDIRGEYRTLGGTVELVGFQALLLNPLGGVLALVGLLAGFRRPQWGFFRPVSIAYLVLLVGFAITGGKHYYLLGLLPPLAAGGSVVLAEHWSAYRMKVFTVLAGVTALFPVPALLPVLPATTFDASFYPALNEDSLETVGWPQVVNTVRGVLDELPADERGSAVVVTQNYGEAGALLWYGVDAPVASGHNGFGDWGPPTRPGPVVYVGFRAPEADQLSGCRPPATLSTGVNNEEDANAVWVCDGPAGSWRQAWKHLQHFSA